MNPSSKSDLNNIVKSDNTKNNKSDLSKEKNVIINNPGCKPKKIIKKIVQINPEKILNLGIADQILAAVRKLNANNDLPPSINIDLSSVNNINSQHFKIPTTKSKKLFEPSTSKSLPSTSKASVQPFARPLEKKSNINQNEKLNIIKGRLSEFLQGRQNSKLTTNLSEEKKAPQIIFKQTINNQSLKSNKIDDNLNNTTEIPEKVLLNSILSDTPDEKINTEKNEIHTNRKMGNHVIEKQNVNIFKDLTIKPIKSPPIHQYPRQRKISEGIIQSDNQLQPKVRILHEIKSEKTLDLLTEEQTQKQTEKCKKISNELKNNSEITLPNIPQLKNPTPNLFYENYCINDMKKPSFSDLTSYIIDGSKTTELNTSESILPDLNYMKKQSKSVLSLLSPKTEIVHNLNVSQIELEPKPTPSSSRRKKIIPIGILNKKKNAENLKTSQLATVTEQTVENSAIKTPKIYFQPKKLSHLNENAMEPLTSKVTVNINGTQVTNYKPSRKRKSSTTITETQNLSTTKNKIVKIRKDDIEDKSKEKLNFPLSVQEEHVKSVLTTEEEKFEIKQENFEIKQENFEINDENFVKNPTILGNNLRIEDQNQLIEQQSLSILKELKEEDGVDFLVKLGDNLNKTDYYSYSSSESDVSLDSDNSDFLNKFPILQTEIKTEIIDNDYATYDNNDGTFDNDDIESPNYESVRSTSIDNIDHFQQNQNELSLNLFSNFQTSSPTQRKPIVLENKILKEDEKMDLIYIKNIPCFETPTKSNCDIGRTILLQPCEFITSENSHQTFKITELENDGNITSEHTYEKNENIIDEINTFNQNEEICLSVNDSNQEISNIYITDKLIKTDQYDTEIMEETPLKYVNDSNVQFEITNSKYKNELETDKTNEISINNEINIKNENRTTDIKSAEDLKSDKPLVKPKRMRGGKINLIPRIKQTIKKTADISPKIKNIEETPRQLIEEAKNSDISLSDELISPFIKNIEEKPRQLIEEAKNSDITVSDELISPFIKNIEETPRQLIEDAKLSDISLSNEVVQSSTKSNLINSVSTSTKQDILREHQIQEKKDTSEKFSNHAFSFVSSSDFGCNSMILDKNTNLNIVKLNEIKQEEQKEDMVIIELNEKKSDKKIIVNSCIQHCIDENEDISRNSSLNDSLEIEEPFYGFEDTEMKIDNDKTNKDIFENIVSTGENLKNNILNINENGQENIDCIVYIDESIENNILNVNKNAIAGENIVELIKNDSEIQKTKYKNLVSTNKNIKKLHIKENFSKLCDVERKNSTYVENDTLKNKTKTDKKNNEKRSRKSSTNKTKTSNNKSSNTHESVITLNLKNTDISESLHSDKKIISKLSKRRILDSSEDDANDNIPLKKRSIRKSSHNEKSVMHVEDSSINLTKNETLIKKTNTNFEHDGVIEKKSKRKDSDIKKRSNSHVDTKLITEKSIKEQKNRKKSKILKKEIVQNDPDKTITATQPVSATVNEIKTENFPNTFESSTLDLSKNVINNSSADLITNSKKTISNRPKNSVKKPKNITKEVALPVQNKPDILSGTQIKTPTKVRGRKAVDRKIHPRLLLIDNRADIDKEDVPINDVKKMAKNEIQCGMCKEVILKTTWEKHKKNHYGIGWKMGEESIDLSSHSAVLNSLINCFKTVKIKSLSCRLCHKAFASGLGILVHLEMCGLSEEEKRKQCFVKCEHCNGDYSRYSLPSHLKVCRELKMKNDYANEEKHDTNIIIGNTGRLKRKSMIRAEDKFKDFDKTEFDVGDFIKSVSCVRGGHFRSWKKEITTNGTATCIGIGCNLKFNTYDEIREHVKVCKFLTKSGYRCTRCKYHNNCIEEIRKHILNEHKFSQKDFHSSESEEENYDKENETSTEDESSGVDENDEEEKRSISDGGDSGNDDNNKTVVIAIREKSIKTSNKYKKILDITKSKDDIKLFWNWTDYFFKYNYSRSILFPNITVNCKRSDMKLDLFVPKNNLSMKFSFSTIPINQKFNSSKPSMEWMELEYFKSATFKNEQLIFIGGPITSLKWLPTDNNKNTPEYLAITYKKNYNKFIHSINAQKQKTLVLIYKIGLAREFNNTENLSNLQYGITCDDGPINDIDFLPSGGYIPEINRLGLLAIASSTNNDIIIYSLPIKAPQNCDIITNSLKLIDLKIGMQLKLKLLINKNDKLDEIYNVMPTKICWSKAKEHQIIVAGYTNGFVAIWNLQTEDNLNFLEINDIPTFLPINYFRTSNKSITGLDLHYDSNGTRWLIIANSDRNYKVIDIEDPCNPIIITEDIVKTFVTSTVWPLIWENPCYSTSDELYQSSVHTLNPLIIYYKHRRYARQSSSINDISFNNWNNIMACGGNNGDFSIELNGKMNLDVTQRHDKKLHSYTDLIRLDGEEIIDTTLTESVKFFDIDYRNKYGLIFGPIKYVHKDLTYLQKKRNPPIYMNCYVKINRVSSNNNEYGKQLFAIGYENGFIRILYINNN